MDPYSIVGPSREMNLFQRREQEIIAKVARTVAIREAQAMVGTANYLTQQGKSWKSKGFT